MFIGLLMARPGNLRAVAQPPHILPASLLLLGEHLAGPTFDPLSDLGGVPHPSVGRGLLERFSEFLLLFSIEQRPISSTRILVTTIAQSFRTIAVVTTSELLDPASRISGYLHYLAGSLTFADEPEDLVVAA
jgi:hypothetical protein